MHNWIETFLRADDGERIFLSHGAGGGRPVVFLHGWTANHTEWAYYASALAGHYTVYAWDARGHGGHEPVTVTPPTVERMAADLDRLLRAYRLEAPVLVAHSMGVLVTWEYIRRYGCAGLGGLVLVDQTAKLVTDADWRLGIYGDFDAAANRRFIAALREDFAEGVLRLAAEGHNRRARDNYHSNTKGWQRQRDYLRSLNPGPLIRCWESLSAADFRPVLPTIGVPTLLVYGDESNFYSLATAHYVRDRIPGAELRVYAGADHSPHLWQRERFVKDVAGFAAGLT